MSIEEVKDTKNILRLMEEACSGRKEALESFYKTFLESDVYIIERASQGASPREPKYPNEFFRHLGIRGGDKTWLPIFTSEEALAEWSTQPLNSTVIKGAEVLNIIPADWWLVLNPGTEVSKEFSPWEVNTLKSGPDGIAAAAEDQMAALVVEQEYGPLELKDRNELAELITEFGLENADVFAITPAVERSIDSDGNITSERIIFGIACAENTKKERVEELKQTLLQRLGTKLIGEDNFEILIGVGDEPLVLGRLKDINPFYTKKSEHISLAGPIALIGLLLAALFLLSLQH